MPREGWKRQPFAFGSAVVLPAAGRKSYSGQPDPQGHARKSIQLSAISCQPMLSYAIPNRLLLPRLLMAEGWLPEADG